MMRPESMVLSWMVYKMKIEWSGLDTIDHVTHSPTDAKLSALGLHFSGHDANVCVSHGGTVLAVLELERLFEVQYFETCMLTCV